MRTAYELALNHFSLNLGDPYIKENEANNQETIVGIGNSIGFYDIHNFDDKMHIDTPISRNFRHGFSFESHDEKFYDFMDIFPPLDPSAGIGTWYNDADVATNVGIASTAYYVGYKTVKNSLENVTKGMLLALLDGDSKRTSTVGIGSTSEKLKIFFNTLGFGTEGRDTTLKPWGGPNAFYTTHSTITGITSISRLNNVATVILNSNHGLDTNYDDWGAVITLNSSSTQSYSINVINNGSGAYTLSGNDRNGSVSGDNDTVNINVGDTITFNVNASGHPFWIKTSAITGNGYAVSGVINNGSQNGSVSWTPSSTGTYYYICQYHSSMNGIISVGSSSGNQSGISSSFNISTSTYPNGVPIVLTSNNSFTYRNIGLNTSHTSGITGTIDVKVGWGGTSNNLHLHFD